MIEKRASGRYRVRVYHRGREIASKTFDRKCDAVLWERAQKHALASGTWVALAERGVTLAEWYSTWRAAYHQRKLSTETGAEALWRLHIVPAFGRRPVATISHTEVATWARALVGKRSPSTARQALGELRRCLDAAVRANIITRNPCTGVKLPTAQPGEPHPLTREEVGALVEAMPTERDRVLVLVAAYGGLRWGELAALRVADLSRDRASVRVARSASAVAGVIHEGPVKTYAARTVPLPRFVAAAVSEWITSASLDRRSRLFPSAAGGPLDGGNWTRRVFKPALVRAGLDGQGITPHCLRDTAASLAIADGASAVAVAALLGHQSAQTTLRHYVGAYGDVAKIAAAHDAAHDRAHAQ